jgi:pSer/pThr/pTyr-binding forkhead associated (FHA) protein
MIKLTVKKDGEIVTCLETDQKTIKIGRKDDNDIVLDSPTVSRQHTVITKTGKKYTVADMYSSNGTVVNHKIIDSCDLEDGAEIIISPFTINVEIS